MDGPHTPPSPLVSRKFPVKTALAAVVILAAAAAVLVFDVPVGKVLTYLFLGLMMFSHLLMHGSHGGHDHGASTSQQSDEHNHHDLRASQISENSQADGLALQNKTDDQTKPNQHSHQGDSGHSGHSGCC